MTTSFNPSEHLIQIKTKQGLKDYLPVAWRLVWFRQSCPTGTITTEMVTLDVDRETTAEGFVWNEEKRRNERVTKRANGFCVMKATITDGNGGHANGYKSEGAAGFPDYIEKAETGAVGRALIMLGYGLEHSADDLAEGHEAA